MERPPQNVCEEFQYMRQKAEKIFSRLRALPAVGAYWEPFFEKAFNTYSKLWKMQQQHRTVLETTPPTLLKRWEVGELAARIAQLYYHYYLRTSDTCYLHEAYMFYSAIRSRAYFKDAGAPTPSGAVPAVSAQRAIGAIGSLNPASRLPPPSAAPGATSSGLLQRNLRYHARFLLVCIFFGVGDDVLDTIVTDMKLLVLRFITEANPPKAEVQQWQALLEEIKSFQAHHVPVALREASGKITPYVESGRLRLPEGAPAPADDRGRMKLRNAVIVGTKRTQVKFSELTLDMLRVMLSLEVEFHQQRAGGAPGPAGAAAGAIGAPGGPDAQDQPHRNPHKYLLYQGSVSQLLNHMATLSTSLGQNEAMLLYLSSDAAQYTATGGHVYSGLRLAPEANYRSSSSSSTVLTPLDLQAYTRRPLVLVVDSDGSQPFASLTSPYGEPLMCLLSPLHWEGSVEPGLFTLFLHAPLPAFCVLCGVRTPQDSAFHQSAADLADFFNWLADYFRSLPGVSPVLLKFFEDEFLQQFIMRFVFCYATLSLFQPSNARGPDWMPVITPALPPALLAEQHLTSIVTRIATNLGVSALFGPPQPEKQQVSPQFASPAPTGPSPLMQSPVPVASPPASPLVVPAPPLPPSPYTSSDPLRIQVHPR